MMRRGTVDYDWFRRQRSRFCRTDRANDLPERGLQAARERFELVGTEPLRRHSHAVLLLIDRHMFTLLAIS